MARGINKVILVGNLGQDPEVRSTQNGIVTRISLATTDSWKDKQTGQKQERTEWHRVVFFNRLAEIVGDFTNKGARIYVEGSLRTSKWQDKDGNDRYTTEIVGDRDLVLLDGRGSKPDSPSQPSAATAGQATPAAPNDFDDDIPF